jgi:hypothetical protein
MAHARMIGLKLEKGSFNLSRDSDTVKDARTNRIYHNLVSLSSKALPYVTINNNSITGLDIKTSQFALLANLFKHYAKTEDQIASTVKGPHRKRFVKSLYECYKEVSNGIEEKNRSVDMFYEDVLGEQADFYTKVQEELGLNDRGFAKLICFNILFSKDTNHNKFKTQIINMYPVIFRSTELFKQRYGYEKLSINLQALEAEIVIDRMFNAITKRKNGVLAFTRHDSILVEEHNCAKAKAIMEEEASAIDFKFKIVEEHYKRPEDDEEMEEDNIEIPYELKESLEAINYDQQAADIDLLEEVVGFGIRNNLLFDSNENELYQYIQNLKDDLPRFENETVKQLMEYIEQKEE